MAAPALRRGAGLRRAAVRRLRPALRPRAHRHRRGARLLLQAGGRPALRRAGRRPPSRLGGGRGAAGGERDAAPRELGRARPPRAPRAGRRPAAAAGRGPRHARGGPASGAAPRRHPRRARVAGAGSQGDRHGQPARVLPAPQLRLLWRGGALPALRRIAGPPSRCGPARLPSLRSRRADPEALPRLRLGLDDPPRRRHRADRGARARADRSGRGLSPRRRRRRPARRPRPGAGRVRCGRRGRARGNADGRQGPRLPRRRAQRPRRRRLDAPLSRLPRRGAYLRPRRPARRAQRPRRAGRAGPDPDARAGLAADHRAPPATTPRAFSPGSWSDAASSAIRRTRRSSRSS